MLFNSFNYLLFLPITVSLCWFLLSKNVKIQNLFLLTASYIFYGYWNWRYLSLVILCSTVNYIAGILLIKTENHEHRKLIVIFCCFISLGILGLFKYYNFFISSFINLLGLLSIHVNITILNLILPVGISFYTLHTLTYTFEVYKRKFEPTKDIVSFFLFVSIFPLAMAGPIERATNLLPQLYKKRRLNYDQIVSGLRLILWGFFMKVVIADRLAVYVDSVYNNVSHHSGITLALATVFFSFQLYCDFAGYSNIAIGCGKLLGLNFIVNFKRPYMSVSITDFWRRWHISLSTWFRDYVYIPLGGNRCSSRRHYCNLMITFLISGLWHGSDWTFVIWGGLNGLFMVIGEILFPIKKYIFQKTSSLEMGKIKYGFDILVTFGTITFLWIFFRAKCIDDAFLVIEKIVRFNGNLFTDNIDSLAYGSVLILVLWFSELMQERNSGKHYFFENRNKGIRHASYLTISLLILLIGVFDSSQFIYFQF